ncbi:MAG TPA: hypothetical protein VJ547_12220 [Candidatus Thermoplasmatota archaeon]|nr:hypothetical protein [Candidatus Thermoplasmatota archaeon]
MDDVIRPVPLNALGACRTFHEHCLHPGTINRGESVPERTDGVLVCCWCGNRQYVSLDPAAPRHGAHRPSSARWKTG